MRDSATLPSRMLLVDKSCAFVDIAFVDVVVPLAVAGGLHEKTAAADIYLCLQICPRQGTVFRRRARKESESKKQSTAAKTTVMLSPYPGARGLRCWTAKGPSKPNIGARGLML